jgi:hypothetical protein
LAHEPDRDTVGAVAVENDYNLLLYTLNNIAESATTLRDEVGRRRLQEAQEGLEPNQTRWLQLMITRLPYVSGPATQLEHEADRVLHSAPGEAVFDAEPPPAPDPGFFTD